MKTAGHYLYQTIDFRKYVQISIQGCTRKRWEQFFEIAANDVVLGCSDAGFRTVIPGHHHKPGDFVVQRSE